MSVNKEKPHILILPEDDANRSMALGFLLEIDPTVQRQVFILQPAGGWLEAMKAFEKEHIVQMGGCPHCNLVILLDSDGRQDRLEKEREKIPLELRERVFLLGALEDPETLKANLKLSLEKIGTKLAQECRDEAADAWAHADLRHNEAERTRIQVRVRGWLFP